MKKILWVLALLLVVAPAFAGSVTPKVGLKAGLAMTNLTGDDVDELWGDEAPDSKMGLAVGAFVGIPVGTLTIQPELLYVQKGAKIEETIASHEVKVTGKADYLEIPVLFKFSFGETSAKPFFYVGPVLGILMSAEYKEEVSGPVYNDSETTDIKDDSASMEFGLCLGAGVDVNKLSVELRYEMGMTTISDPEDWPDDLDKPDVKNTAIMLLVGYAFN